MPGSRRPVFASNATGPIAVRTGEPSLDRRVEEVPNAVPTGLARRGAARSRRLNAAVGAPFPKDSANVCTLTGSVGCTC